LKQTQQANEEPLQSNSKREEQVSNHSLDSSSVDEPLRMARLDPLIEATTNDFKVEISEFQGKLDPEEFLDWLHTVERIFVMESYLAKTLIKM